MKKIIIILFAFTAIIFALKAFKAGINAQTPQFDEAVRISGSTTVLPLAQAAAENYMSANPKADISVRGGGSGVGINQLLSGMVEIANSSRPAKAEEIQKAQEAGATLTPNIIALDAIAIIVNPANNINNLTRRQIKEIYTGKIRNWSALGGADEKIVLIGRDATSGTGELFNEKALENEPAAGVLDQAANPAVANLVAASKGAIGYVGLGFITEKIKPITIEGVEAGAETVLADKYAYSRPLYMYTLGAPQGGVKDFLDYLQSKDGQALAPGLGFIPLK
ncbi:MAG: phosphate ABC transporter substrate-binding protein [Elusimicrobiota bacterium]|jgi:phosphate transport system substrate-binding protein|nr:phosphate ABC transporter substrate-binding protein [Elusimicrobiota bacterium]